MLIGLAVAASSGLSWAKATAKSVGIISDIGELRDSAGPDVVQPVEIRTSETLDQIKDSFVPAIWLGISGFVVGCVGFLTAMKREKTQVSSKIRQVRNDFEEAIKDD